MPDDKSLSVFKCPSCGAPIHPETDSPTMKCPYCGAAIVIPESLRNTASSSMSLSDVSNLAKQGKFDEAAKIYSKITGLSHEYALISVKSMAGVRDGEPASNFAGTVSQPQARPTYQAPPSVQPTYTPPKVRSTSCLSGVIRFVIFIAVLSTAVPSLLRALQFNLPSFFSSESPIIPVPFAKEVMSFSPGTFKDPRAIGLDGNGNILVLDYNNDEVLIFDAEGNGISSIKVSNNGNRIYADNMVVSSDGIIYIPISDRIMALNENGESLSDIYIDDFAIIHSISIGPDDTLYAMTSDGILRFDESGAIDLKISSETLEEVSGEFPGFGVLAGDARGNIYFSGDFETAILKFSPDGEFISKFGGKASGDFKPGEFNSPRQIAFDGYGRIYVVDFFDVQVFDSNFNYLDRIEGQFWGVDFDSQNNMYTVTNLSDDVEKYEVQKPAP